MMMIITFLLEIFILHSAEEKILVGVYHYIEWFTWFREFFYFILSFATMAGSPEQHVDFNEEGKP